MTDHAAGDLAAYIAGALAEVCFGPEEIHPLEATVDRYFAPDYRQRTDGEEVDRRGFVEHIRALRRCVREGRVEVLEAIQQGDRIADRHRVSITRWNGSICQVEVHLFGELAADGRLRRVDEVSRVVVGGADDAELAIIR